MTPKIYLGIPNYGGLIYDGHFNAILQAGSKYPIARVEFSNYSMLTHNFNRLLCAALNARPQGISHFALLHNDVIPEPGWMDILFSEMSSHQADMISAVIPIKFDKGLTSTALEVSVQGSDPAYRPKRLTLHEVFNDFEETFTHEKILLNTGCMLLDLKASWVEGLWFEFQDWIEKVGDQFIPRCVPEDWNFSRRARAKGAKLFATRKVRCLHVGERRYPNDRPWGTLQKDQLE